MYIFKKADCEPHVLTFTMDKLTKGQRQKNVKAVKAIESKIEVALAKLLFAREHGYRKNNPKVFGKLDLTSRGMPFGDITKEKTKSYIPDEFDILCVGFPCQAFSIVVKRGEFEGTIGTLFFDIAQIISRKRSRTIFLENVKGLINHGRGKTLSTILNVLRSYLEYLIPEPEIVNTKEFGDQQYTKRTYFVGFHKDILDLPLLGKIFHSNFFLRFSQNRFPLQSLTQKAA